MDTDVNRDRSALTLRNIRQNGWCNMELHYLEIFDTVSRLGSYKLASSEMHISQPALSNEMKKLEGQIGFRLFDRRGNGVVLNNNGMILRNYTSRIFDIVDDMEGAISDLRDTAEGEIHIGASNTPGAYIMPLVMADYKKTYPLVTCSMTVGDTSEIEDLVNKGRLDAAVNGGERDYGDRIITQKLFTDRLVFVSSPDNILAEKEIVTIGDLSSIGFIVHKVDSQLYVSYKKFIGRAGLHENIVMTLGNIDAIKNAVKTDIGISLLPEMAVRRDLQEGSLVMLRTNLPKIDYPYNLIRNKRQTLTTADKRFISMLVSKMMMCS